MFKRNDGTVVVWCSFLSLSTRMNNFTSQQIYGSGPQMQPQIINQLHFCLFDAINRHDLCH